MLMHRPRTPQPGFDSVTLLQKFTPHFKILDPRLTCCRVLQHCMSLNNVCEEILQDFSVTPSTLSCPCFLTRAQFNHQFSPSWVRQNTDELFSYTVVWRKWKACQVCGGWKQRLQYNVKLLQLSECLPRKCTIHITFEKGCRNIERRMLKCTRQPQKDDQ